jgi:hypothetical protein
MAGSHTWQFDFVIFKRGEKEPVASSVKTSFWNRSASLELPLEAGEYVVHVSSATAPLEEMVDKR